MKRFILWSDYGSEGWRPQSFDTLEEVYAAIKIGETFGEPFEITELVPFKPGVAK